MRFVVTDRPDREIDLHPLLFAADGSAEQASPDHEHPFTYPASRFVTGTILGATVPCLSPQQQVSFHQGYETRRSRPPRHDPAPADVRDHHPLLTSLPAARRSLERLHGHKPRAGSRSRPTGARPHPVTARQT
ncbi:hypothetical protein GCM10010103_62020 [Streptomyces paradoxus]